MNSFLVSYPKLAALSSPDRVIYLLLPYQKETPKSAVFRSVCYSEEQHSDPHYIKLQDISQWNQNYPHDFFASQIYKRKCEELKQLQKLALSSFLFELERLVCLFDAKVFWANIFLHFFFRGHFIQVRAQLKYLHHVAPPTIFFKVLGSTRFVTLRQPVFTCQKCISSILITFKKVIKFSSINFCTLHIQLKHFF